MKKILFIAVMLFAVCGTLDAQVRTVIMNIDGDYDIEVEVGRNQFVTMSSDGRILDIYMDGAVEYYDRFNTTKPILYGKVRRVGGTVFEYFDGFSSFDKVKEGKVSRIGSTRFDYFDDFSSFDRPKAGLLKRAGNTNFDYYDGFSSFDKVKTGKVRRIGSASIDYYDDFSSFDREKAGLLKSVNNNRYDYYEQFSGNRPYATRSGNSNMDNRYGGSSERGTVVRSSGSRYSVRRPAGLNRQPLQVVETIGITGVRDFVASGIRFIITDTPFDR